MAQQFSIGRIEIGGDNRARINYTASSNHYYLLLRGDSITNIIQPVNATLFSGTTAALTDPNLVGVAQSAFYALREVPVSQPLDSDGDRLDDVYELLRPLYLNPLNPDDGPQAPETPIITYPTNATMASFVIFSGRAPTNMLIRVEGGAAYVTNLVDATGAFEVTVPLNPNRLNRLFVSTINEFGEASPPAPVDILQDSTPPSLFIDFPINGMVLTTETTLVAGRVGDALSGFLGLSVAINNQPANVDVGIGPNGTYQRMDVPLSIGTNEITVIAIDRLGNSTTRHVTVIREEPTGPRVLAISGDLQHTNIKRRLAEPLVVKVTQAGGAPWANKLLEFRVTRSDGRLLPLNTNQLAADITTQPDYSTNGTMLLRLFTDANGEARAWWTMGMDAGTANNRVSVSCTGITETAFFCASALALPAKQINIGSGNNQRGETFGPAPEPLKVWVSDGNNPVAGIPVTFRVVQGGGALLPIVTADGTSPAGPGLRAASRAAGSFAIAMAAGVPPATPSDAVTVFTSVTGHAEVDFTFGPAKGNQIIEATFIGNNGLPATFVLYGLERVPGQPTKFVGLIQDNAMQPIGNARVDLEVAGAHYEARSNPQGHFAFSDIASGAGHLKVDGTYANSLGTNAIPTNSFPSLQYAIMVVPNAENSLPTPVLLPRLNTNNAQWYYGTNDLVVTCEGITGLKMTIKANSMKHPGGEIVSPVRPALVSLNQVHHDDIPMPMPDGAAPPFAWTLQPGGATFDPPVQVEYPNMSGLAPGAAAFFLTFNHDTERFEIVASGHVIEDGSKIITDPGAGLTISGWGCNCPPYAVIGECEQCPEPTVSVDGLLGDIIEVRIKRSKLYNYSLSSGVFPIGFLAEIDNWADILKTEGRFYVVPTAEGITRIMVNAKCRDSKGRERSTKVRVNLSITDGFSDERGANPVRSGLTKLAIYSQQQRLRYFGFPGASQNGAVLSVNGILDGNTMWAIGLFRAATMDSDHNPLAQTINMAFINSSEAPRWVIVNPKSNESSDHPSGTSWARAIVVAASATEASVSDTLADISLRRGGDTPDHSSHEAGMDIDVETDSDNRGNPPFYAVRRIGAESFITAKTPDDPTGGNHVVALGDSGYFAALVMPGLVPPIGAVRHVVGASDTDLTATVNQEAVLTGISNLIVSPAGYQLEVILRQIRAFKEARLENGVSVARILYNDPRTWSEGAEFEPGHGGHFHVDIRPPTVPAPISPLSLVKSAAPRANALLTDESESLAEGWTVSVGGQSVQVDSDGGFRIPNISAPDQFGADGPGTAPDFVSDDYVRLVGQSTSGDSNRYVFSEFFQIRQGETYSITNLTFTGVPPRKPESLSILVSNRTVRVGDNLPLAVIAGFPDGSTPNVAARTSWTSYRVSNPNIATVSPDGVVTGQQPGVVYVTAVNEGAAAVSGLNIAAGTDGFTTVTGTAVDSNGIPVTSATVRIYDLIVDPVTTDAAGRFSIPNVPTTLGPLRLSVRVIINGHAFIASVRLQGVSGGQSEAGLLVLLPITGARVAAGYTHTVAVRADGTLWAWGTNWSGQLGNGTYTSVATPQPIGTNATWQGVTAGRSHTVALRADGTLWAWGYNGSGQLGNGTFTRANTPQPIATNATWQAAAAGDSHTVALRDDGTLWTWGGNFSGQLGNGTFASTNAPQPIATNATWQAIAAGDSHTVALRHDGTLWAWGDNGSGQLGNGTFTRANTPQPIGTNANWQAVAAGGSHTVALRDDGTLWAWGQLGNGTLTRANTPQPIGTSANWQAVAARDSHTVALRDDGTLWAWAWGASANTPHTLQPIGTNATWQAVAAGGSYTVALRAEGTLWAWGDNRSGQLGNGTSTSANTPQPIATNATWQAVAAGGFYTVALRADGTLWAWGRNDEGQLGNDTSGFGTDTTSTNTPQPLQTNATWQAVAAGQKHTLALRADGTLWAWGHNGFGQLGNGTFGSANTPQPIGTNAIWQAAAAGDLHTVALRADGTLWTWGWNDEGQLGNDTFTHATTPQPIGTNTNWQAVAAGQKHTLALRADGTLWAWGYNGYGQLGNGTFGSANTPQRIETNANWQAFAAGDLHTVALRTDGTLWTWGRNDEGQLGNGTSTTANTPQPIATNATWQAVAASFGHTVALRTDGTLWTWGWNDEGQLGNGTSTSANTPQPIATNATWQAVAAGQKHTLALRADGTLWAWGHNGFGQIAQPVPWLPHPVIGGAVWGMPRAP